ncbi:MAG: MFS transporter [Desulfovibrio sp.]|nr:MFS transporter [Desulfovibrio sp.]
MSIQKPAFLAERLACAYFFVMPALAYGILTSRLPALKTMLNADDGAIGFMLLALGLSTLVGLVACNFLIERFNARSVTGYAALFLAIAMTIAGIAASYWQITLFCLIAGFGVGLCDVGMNAQGIFLERSRNILCMSFLHASSSIGGVCGSLSGSLFAELELAPFWNFALILGPYLLIWPLAYFHMPVDKPARKAGTSRPCWAPVPMFVCICGLLSLVCHIAEGSSAEWGSLLLNTVKGASQEEAALVFASFTGAMVICRLGSDALRRHVSDRRLAVLGSLTGSLGMAVAILSPWPWLCLCGYAIMGAGLAPIVPILFSRAGSIPDVTPGKASAVVSVFSYAGLLLFPPFLGMLGEAYGLTRALWLISILCLLMAAGSQTLRPRRQP